MKEINKEVLESSKGTRGFTQPQARLAIGILGNRWETKIIGRCVEDKWWDEFCKLNKKGHSISEPAFDKKRKKRKVKKAKSRKKGNNGKNLAKRKRLEQYNNDDFYSSREWRTLRVRVLEKYECKCMMCGRSPRGHGIVIHVDHIKSRSKYPKLELVFENLQLLCEDCNLGKSNKYETDWRPRLSKDEVEELDIIYEAGQRI